jgi:PAS domain S-box-containing protein
MLATVRFQIWLPRILASGIALVGIVSSLLAADQQEELARQVGQARFVQAADSLTESLNGRIEAYAEIAIGLRGLFIVNPALNRRDFQTAVSHLDIDARYPGIKNIAFTRYLAAADKPGFEKQVRLDTSIEPKGYPDFNIHPPGERSEYFVADYLWPTAGNTGIHGLDISAQPANLDSMHYTMQSGKPVASAPFDLLQETANRTGFVIRVPVFRSPGPNEISRQAAPTFLGSVAVTLRTFDLLQQLEREGRTDGLLLKLTDVGSAISPQTATPLKLSLFATPPASKTYGNLYSRELNLYGRKWLFDFQSARPLISESERNAPLLLASTGIVISLLIGATVGLLARKRTLAMLLASARGDALKLSEDRWRFAIEGSGDGLWDRDLKEKVTFYSRRWKEILGYETDATIDEGDDWHQRIHPDDLNRVNAEMQEQLSASSTQFKSEYRVRTKDGDWKWVLERGMVFSRDQHGNPLRVIGACTDISDRKKSEHEMEIGRALLDAVVDGSTAVIYATDIEGRFLLVNQTLEDILGKSRSDLLGKTRAQALLGVMPPHIAEEHSKNDQAVAASGQPYEGEEANIEADGTHYYQTRKYPLRDASGAIFGVAGISIDLTQRKRMEVALEASVKDKEALLKEVHHRVKNNMQVITSLLRLESRRSTVDDTKAVLGDMQSRIRAMALLHESLYRAGTFASVDLGSYLRQLSTQSFQTQATDTGAIKLELNLGSVQVGMDQAIPGDAPNSVAGWSWWS